MFNRFIYVTLAAAAMLLSACTQKETTPVTQKGELVVAMDLEMPGYFIFGGENYGYQYDLLKTYADHIGVQLKIVGQTDPYACSRMMRNGEIDMIATLQSHAERIDEGVNIPVYNTTYVLLARKGSEVVKGQGNRLRLLKTLSGSDLIISSSFKSTKIYHTLLDSLSNTNIYVPGRNSFELIEALGSGECDFVICEMSEAQLGCAMTRNVEQIYAFKEQVPLNIIVTDNDPELSAGFRSWLESFRNSKEYAELNYMYFDKGIVKQFINGGKARVVGGISIYDNIIKRISEEAGHDWRFISAIAYNESRFNARITSRKGAQGLMQVMPSVARRLGNGKVDLMVPEDNVMMAVKILDKIQNSLRFPDGTPYVDRMSIVLACYNAGIGHVLDARALARKYGADPNSWEDVSYYLKNKSKPEFLNDEVVKCGRVRGGETLAFVEGVLDKYNSYCNTIKR